MQFKNNLCIPFLVIAFLNIISNHTLCHGNIDSNNGFQQSNHGLFANGGYTQNDNNNNNDNDEMKTETIIKDIISKIKNLINEQNHHDNFSNGIISRRNDDNDASTIRSASRRPFVTLSYAQTLNGMIAQNQFKNLSSNLAISCPESFQMTHALRSIHDGILVGKNTMTIDNPRLTNRLWNPHTKQNQIQQQSHQPRPIILDSNLKWFLHQWKHANASLRHIRAQHCIVCCNKEAFAQFRNILQHRAKSSANNTFFIRSSQHDQLVLSESIGTYENQTITLLSCQTMNNETKEINHIANDDSISFSKRDQRKPQLDLKHVLEQLYHKCGIQSIMVEGGSSILSSFASTSSIVDCACVTVTPNIIPSNIGLNAFQNYFWDKTFVFEVKMKYYPNGIEKFLDHTKTQKLKMNFLKHLIMDQNKL